MSADRDTTRIVRSWLRTDEHESADRVLGDVLALLDATPQRRPLWSARRIADMNTFAKLAAAAVAVVAVVVVGYNLLPSRGNSGASPTPTPSSSPGPSAAASASIRFPPAGELTAGRHTLIEDDTVFSMQVPDGWHSSGPNCSGCANAEGGWLQRGPDDSTDPGSVWMPIWSVDGVAADPCTRKPAPVATSVTELADDVATIPGTDVVTTPEDVVIGGRPGKHVVIQVAADIGCPARQFYLWADHGIFRFATALEQTNYVWIVELEGGGHFWIEAETYAGSTPALEHEIQAMIDSIQFE